MEKAASERIKRRQQWWGTHKKFFKKTEETDDTKTSANKVKPMLNALRFRTEVKTEDDGSTNTETKITRRMRKGKGPKVETPEEQDSKRPKKVKTGYVLFVGNLPYNVSKEDVANHFSTAGEVKAVRLLTDKLTDQPRGFAYVEFFDSQTYQEAFKLHRSKLHGRQINVEFTAPGGRKSEHRKNKIKRKNILLEKFIRNKDRNSET